MTSRLFITAAILLGMYGGVVWVRGRGMPTDPAPLDLKIEDLPMTLGDWKGESIPMDPEMFEAISAKMAIDRSQRVQNRRIGCHMRCRTIADDGNLEAQLAA